MIVREYIVNVNRAQNAANDRRRSVELVMTIR